MRTDTPQTIHLKDYEPTPYAVDKVELTFRLAPEATRVKSRIAMRPRGQSAAPLVLDGEDIALVSIAIDGGSVEHRVEKGRLVVPRPPQRAFTLEIETECDPKANTRLSGLYLSNGNYCTQCEAEGFRRIAYYYDRPDVMAPFTVRIEAPKPLCPVLLSNGNPGASGDIPGTDDHFAEWIDPHPKPAYLFALVAGDLAGVSGQFATKSGRAVDLRIYVEKGKEDRCAWAMESLKASMRWDEERFGREYDLDVFSIVAVSDFNMGAMENKGLNIFNDKYILARPDTATDGDYLNIEAIIAHEYFHNWTGNRVTCRDWFQLCLKEGLTVFRDQEFTSDLRSRAVKRISDVKTLRARQFPEDGGPLAHPVRPSSYIEINNFYTATVYEKGAELCRMLLTLIGRDAFRKAMDIYFERHDGEAATVEDFVRCMADASGRDLKDFFRWYEQAGTPRVAAKGVYDAAKKTYDLTVTQETKPTPGQPAKRPLPIPLGIGLVGPDGEDMPLDVKGVGVLNAPVIELVKAKQTYHFRNVPKRPVLSLNRGFSAPIRLETGATLKDELFLMGRDGDTFNRWEAAQSAGRRLIIAAMKALKAKRPPPDSSGLSDALRRTLEDQSLDDAFKELLLILPQESDIATALGKDVDPDLIRAARMKLRAAVYRPLAPLLRQAFARTAETGPYRADPHSMGRRALRYAALGALSAAFPKEAAALALAELDAAPHMTAEANAMGILSAIAGPEREEALAKFYARHRDDHLLVNNWFAWQGMIPAKDAHKRVAKLMDHPDFTLTNPNRARALIGSFAFGNPTGFHVKSGAGYRLFAGALLRIDPLNPQIAARLATAFGSWRGLEKNRRALVKTELERVLARPGLSRDLYEIVSKSLATP